MDAGAGRAAPLWRWAGMQFRLKVALQVTPRCGFQGPSISCSAQIECLFEGFRRPRTRGFAICLCPRVCLLTGESLTGETLEPAGALCSLKGCLRALLRRQPPQLLLSLGNRAAASGFLRRERWLGFTAACGPEVVGFARRF